MRMKFIINNQTLRCVTQSNISAGTINYIGADFQFMTEEWTDLTKNAVFIDEDNATHTFTLEDDSISESATMGLNLTAGSWSCFVYADHYVSGDVAQRITTNSVHFNVNAVFDIGEIGGYMPSDRDLFLGLISNIKTDCEKILVTVNSYQELAKTYSLNSEAWAVGQRDGVDVPSTDETYHNNSKYYASLNHPPIIGTAAPTTSTVGTVGQFYIYNTSLYVCTSAVSSTYTWTLVNGSVVWGSISGTLSNQTDLNTRFTDIEDDIDTIEDDIDTIETNLTTKQNVPSKISTGSSITLADNTEYRLTNVTTLTFAFPSGNFESWICLTTASSGTVSITFPNTIKYIGTVPTFGNSETWEISIKDGIAVCGKAVSVA